MPNIPSLSSVTGGVTALSNLILVSPQNTIGYQPQAKPVKNGQSQPQPPALLFHYEGEQTVSLDSDITDHYVEDNTAIQDQIALKPEAITATGFIGELNNVAPLGLQTLQKIADKLVTISAYTPGLSATAAIAYNEAFFAYQIAQNAVDSAVSSWQSVTGTGGQNVIGSNGIVIQPNQNKQQLAFQQFYGYWRDRTLFTVQTPWAVFQNCAIKTLRAIQSPETRVITDFEVTFKLMRFAQTFTTDRVIRLGDFQGRASTQAAQEVDLGTSTPPPATVSYADSFQAVG